MYFADLSHGCLLGSGSDICAVGWLDKHHSYPKGPVPNSFLETLKRHIQTAWQPVVSAGLYECSFCEVGQTWGAGGNVWIPAPKVVYIAPEMITHYIETHDYQPPDEFIEAVLACPVQDSVEYQQAMQPYLYHWVL